MKKIVMLTYFDRKIGPKVYYSYPKVIIDINLKSEICSFLDLSTSKGYLILVRNGMRVYNFPFELQSSLARGGVDILALSLILDNKITLEKEIILQELFNRFKKLVEYDKEIFYAFYSETHKYIEKKNILELYVDNLYEEMKLIR